MSGFDIFGYYGKNRTQYWILLIERGVLYRLGNQCISWIYDSCSVFSWLALDGCYLKAENSKRIMAPSRRKQTHLKCEMNPINNGSMDTNQTKNHRSLFLLLLKVCSSISLWTNRTHFCRVCTHFLTITADSRRFRIHLSTKSQTVQE